MTSQEFVIWLKGFTEGVHEFNVSPKQWDILKEKLAEVKDEEKFVGRGAPTSPFVPNNYQSPNVTTLCKRVNGGTSTLLTSGNTVTEKQLLKDSTYNYTLKYNDGKSV